MVGKKISYLLAGLLISCMLCSCGGKMDMAETGKEAANPVEETSMSESFDAGEWRRYERSSHALYDRRQDFF